MQYDGELPPVVVPIEQPRAGCLRWGLSLSAAMFNTCFALLVIVTLGGIVFITRPQQVMHGLPPVAWLPLLVIMSPALIYSQWLTWKTIAARQLPTGPAVASRHVAIPFLLRPFVATIWAWNFAIGCAIVIGLFEPEQPGQAPTTAETIFLELLALLLTVPANIYLALMVRTLTDNRFLLETVWRFRIMLDIILTGAVLVYYRLAIWG